MEATTVVNVPTVLTGKITDSVNRGQSAITSKDAGEEFFPADATIVLAAPIPIVRKFAMIVTLASLQFDSEATGRTDKVARTGRSRISRGPCFAFTRCAPLAVVSAAIANQIVIIDLAPAIVAGGISLRIAILAVIVAILRGVALRPTNSFAATDAFGKEPIEASFAIIRIFATFGLIVPNDSIAMLADDKNVTPARITIILIVGTLAGVVLLDPFAAVLTLYLRAARLADTITLGISEDCVVKVTIATGTLDSGVFHVSIPCVLGVNRNIATILRIPPVSSRKR
jgi:hypothetical protein